MFELLDFSLHNLRSIRDAKNIELSKINFLLGMNGSGKSTFMRFFEVLHQSSNVRKKGPLLFYGNNADFGSFDDSICAYREKGDNSIGFGAKFKVLGEPKFLSGRFSGNLEQFSDKCMDFYMSVAQHGNSTYINTLKITFLGHHISLSFDKKSEISQALVNNQDFTGNLKEVRIESLSSLILPLFLEQLEKSDLQSEESFFRYMLKRARILRNQLLVEAKNLASSRTRDDNLLDQLLTLCVHEDTQQQKEDIAGAVKSVTWKKRIDALSPSDVGYTKFVNLLTLSYLPVYVDLIEIFLKGMTRSTYYIGPVRASAQRFYRKQELSVEKIDAFGENVPQLISSLTKKDQQSFCLWTSEFFDFSATASKRSSHIEIKIKTEELAEFNLADVGFGYSQILPILLQLWKFIQRKPNRRDTQEILFFIEQPELHLHPAYQARLIEAICDAIKKINENDWKIKIFIETHSETMINAIADNMETEQISPNEVSILTFEKTKGICEIGRARFDENLILKDWPCDFLSGRN